MNGVLLKQSDLKHGDPAQRSRTWQVDGPPEKGTAYQTEHWDGRLDALVRPKSVSIKLGETPWTADKAGVLIHDRLFIPRPMIGRLKRYFLHQLADDTGAITGSGILVPTWLDMLDTTQLAIDLDLETHKGALFTDTITTNYSTDTAYGVAPYNANETNGGSWPAGGVALVGTVVTEAMTGRYVFDGTDVNVATTTLTAAELYLLYADVLAGDNGICGIDFTAPVSTSNGTFEIQWEVPASGGIFNVDIVA